MITYKIHLIRTGKTADGTVKRYVGQADLPLSEYGRSELEQLLETHAFPPVQSVYTSPLLRCVETAEILFPDRYCTPVEGLADMNLGSFQGHSFDELRDDPAFADWLRDSVSNSPPGGEDAASFTRRIVGAVADIFADMMERSLSSVAVITHGGVIMTLLASICVPKMPVQGWVTQNGTGFTLLMTPQMWMRDRAAEAYATIPAPRDDRDQSDEEWD